MGTEHRLTYAQTAHALGISTDAVRMRVRRGTLRSERDGGRVFVILDPDQPRPDNDETNLTEHLREEVAYLREENQRKDHIIAALVSRVPALQAAAEERPDAHASRDDPSGGYSGTPRPREDPENQTSRGWWSRLFR
jgi:hypothetical protein